MLNFIDAVHHFGARVADAQFLIVTLLDHDEDVFIDRRGKHAAALLEIKFREVGAAAKQADAQGRLNDNQLSNSAFWK
jgi:hypothetical protein